jgi:hypothetical protein
MGLVDLSAACLTLVMMVGAVVGGSCAAAHIFRAPRLMFPLCMVIGHRWGVLVGVYVGEGFEEAFAEVCCERCLKEMPEYIRHLDAPVEPAYVDRGADESDDF